MATSVIRSSVTREVPASPVRGGRPLMVTLAPEGIWFREKGRKFRVLLPYGIGYLQGVKLHVDAEKRSKAAAKKERAAARKDGR